MATSALVDTYAQFPLQVVEGHGTRLRDRAGREYWDFYGGHAVALLGHSHPAVVKAMTEQAATLTFYSNVVPLDIRTRAAERLCRFTPPGLDHVFFCNSGGEANENALKLAIKQTGRKRLAALTGGWHGRSLLALSVTDDNKLSPGFEGVLCDTVRVRCNDVDDIGRIDDSIAAVILEPIQSIAGIVEIEGEFLKALRRRCDLTRTLVIYDEIQTGLGRLGRPFAAGEHDVMPDIMTLAKGLANGIPIGAVMMNERVAAKIKQGDLGSTFGGGPVPCAVMLTVLNIIERENLVAHAAKLGAMMHETLRVGPVQRIRGRGCLIGLELNGPAKSLQKALLERGFVTGTSDHPNVLRLMPPINTPVEAVSELAQAIARLA